MVSKQSPRARLRGALLILSAFALTGCGESTGSVKGKVYFQDKAVTAGTVAFQRAANKLATGQIQPDGSYEVLNAVTGPNKISVRSQVVANVPQGKMMDPGKMGASDKTKGQEAPTAKGTTIPAKYADPEQSGVTYTVNSGPNQFDIKLP